MLAQNDATITTVEFLVRTSVESSIGAPVEPSVGSQVKPQPVLKWSPQSCAFHCYNGTINQNSREHPISSAMLPEPQNLVFPNPRPLMFPDSHPSMLPDFLLPPIQLNVSIKFH